ncbi:S4 domain-containing protein, partial [Brevundimonas sp. UBA2503]
MPVPTPDLDEDLDGATVLDVQVDARHPRLDKALSEALPDVSRARLQALIAAGAVTLDGQILSSGS